MTRFTVRAVPVYVTLLLILALIGAYNQRLYLRQLALMDQKEALIVRLTDLRSGAAQVSGPLAITSWARNQGMIPAPEGARVVRIAAQPPPVAPSPPSGLELTTRWR